MPSPLSYKSYFNLWNFSITYFNSIKKDIFGNQIIEDSKGNRKIIKKDIFGNTIIEKY